MRILERHTQISQTASALFLTVTPFSLTAVRQLINDASILVLAISTGSTRAASSPPRPASRIAKDTLVTDVKFGVVILVKVVAAVGTVKANELVVVTLWEPINVALLNFSGHGMLTLVFVVVEVVNAKVEFFYLQLLNEVHK